MPQSPKGIPVVAQHLRRVQGAEPEPLPQAGNPSDNTCRSPSRCARDARDAVEISWPFSQPLNIVDQITQLFKQNDSGQESARQHRTPQAVRSEKCGIGTPHRPCSALNLKKAGAPRRHTWVKNPRSLNLVPVRSRPVRLRDGSRRLPRVPTRQRLPTEAGFSWASGAW